MVDYLDIAGMDTIGLREYCSVCMSLCPEIQRGDGMTYEQCKKIENAILELAKVLREQFISIGRLVGMRSPKLHWLLWHLINQCRLFGLCGAVSDQSIEKKHQDGKKCKRMAKGGKSEEERFRLECDIMIGMELPDYG